MFHPVADRVMNVLTTLRSRCTCCSVYWGWVVSVSFLLLNTIAVGLMMSFSELVIPMEKESHQSYAFLGWIGMLPVVICCCAAPVAALVHERFSDRLVVIIGILTASASFAISSFATNIGWMLVIHGVVSGLGMLFILTTPSFLLERYFPFSHPRHVLATSLFACGHPLGTMIFNPVSYELLAAFGWRLTYIALAVLLLVTGLPLAATFRQPREGELDKSVSYQKIKNDPDASEDSDVEQKKPSSHADANQNSTSDPRTPLIEDKLDSHDLGTIEREPEFTIPLRTKIILYALWFVVSTLKAVGYYTPLFTLVKQMDVLNIAQSKASRSMILLGCTELLSRLVVSYFGDRCKGNMLSVYVASTLSLCFLNIFGSTVTTFTPILVYIAFLGALGGPIIAAMYSSCSEVIDGRFVPMVFSVFRCGLGLGQLLGLVTAGAIYDATGSFQIVYYFNAGTYAMTSLLYAIIIAINRLKPVYLFPPPISYERRTAGVRHKQCEKLETETGNFIVQLTRRHGPQSVCNIVQVQPLSELPYTPPLPSRPWPR